MSPIIDSYQEVNGDRDGPVSPWSDCTSSPPHEYVCPISLCVMEDPLMSKDGQNYDRQAILRWLNSGHDTCPLTRKPLQPSHLIPNNRLKMNILRWKMDHPKVDDEESTGDVGNDEDDLSDLLALYEEVMALTGSSDHGSSAAPSDDHAASDPYATPILSSRDEEDLKDILELYDEVMELRRTSR